MTRIIGVRFRTAGKIYYFAPGKFHIKKGQQVIVETAEGWNSEMWLSGRRKWRMIRSHSH